VEGEIELYPAGDVGVGPNPAAAETRCTYADDSTADAATVAEQVTRSAGLFNELTEGQLTEQV